MRKKLLAFSIVCAGLAVSAQSPRLSLFEEFTGETCPPCAATNPGLNLILASPTNTPKVISIKWQVPIPSAPTPTWSLYKTNQAEIDWRWKSSTAGGYGYVSQNTASTATVNGINSAPSGRLDGQHQWVFGATSDHPAYISNGVIATAASYTSAFTITMTRAWDATYSSVNLTVNIVATANFSAVGPLIFRTVMTERHIHFPVQPGTNGEKDFDDVAIRSFPTLQAGTPMTSNWILGQTQTFTLNCPLPSYTHDKSEVAFVGFIQDDGNKKVAQAGRALVDPLPNDAKALTPMLAPMSCISSITPTISIMNNGVNAITALTITPLINAVPQPNYIWAGNLAIGATTVINLSAYTGLTSGTSTFAIDITGVSGVDNNLLNNQAASKFVIFNTPQGTPVAEGFVATTFPPANWNVNDFGAGATFFRTTSAGGFGLSNQSTKLDLYSAVAPNAVNELFLPPMNFTLTSGTLSFDVAYAMYDSSQDQLEVMMSTNCGQSWTTIYNKAGSQLQTTTGSVSAAFTPNSVQWRKEVIQLTNMSPGGTLIKFVATSDYGNNLYIDNVNLSQCASQTVTASASKLVICQGEAVTLTAGGATTYSWSNGQTTSTIQVTPNSTTTYTAYSTDPDACKTNLAKLTVTVSACTGIDESVNSIGHSLFPNPNKGSFVLNSNLPSNTMINIYNNIGQKVFEQVLTGTETQVNTNLAKGVYHYELVRSEINLGNGKLVIE